MIVDYNKPLDTPTPDNTHHADIPALKAKYGDKKVEDSIHYLTYRNVEELYKEEDTDLPIMYVFRHGETEDNATMTFSGWRNIGLTENGIQQAKVLADKLKSKKIDMLFSSDMIRAIDTLKIALSKNDSIKDLPIIKDPRFRERHYGDWQGYSKLIKHLEEPELLHSIRRGYETAPPNGESLEDTVKRMQGFLDDVIITMKKRRINVAISGHGNSIRGIRQYFENLTNEETATIETPLGQDYAAYPIEI